MKNPIAQNPIRAKALNWYQRACFSLGKREKCETGGFKPIFQSISCPTFAAFRKRGRGVDEVCDKKKGWEREREKNEINKKGKFPCTCIYVYFSYGMWISSCFVEGKHSNARKLLQDYENFENSLWNLRYTTIYNKDLAQLQFYIEYTLESSCSYLLQSKIRIFVLTFKTNSNNLRIIFKFTVPKVISFLFIYLFI